MYDVIIVGRGSCGPVGRHLQRESRTEHTGRRISLFRRAGGYRL